MGVKERILWNFWFNSGPRNTRWMMSFMDKNDAYVFRSLTEEELRILRCGRLKWNELKNDVHEHARASIESKLGKLVWR